MSTNCEGCILRWEQLHFGESGDKAKEFEGLALNLMNQALDAGCTDGPVNDECSADLIHRRLYQSIKEAGRKGIESLLEQEQVTDQANRV